MLYGTATSTIAVTGLRVEGGAVYVRDGQARAKTNGLCFFGYAPRTSYLVPLGLGFLVFGFGALGFGIAGASRSYFDTDVSRLRKLTNYCLLLCD
jgi:hypothetical protein